ncbi:MAG: methyltransferase family protein [Candidatus Saganbacteria bacterium]|uniref:Methyltransferase family protein n=1 Tax=Candidatus Saganbacteria bacterium TaxID=2575572 RepID=A0A833NZ56_UNCSA|nr:MAG: methyltransferase family protein [Candidatus Saganbacteria bacterium]
MINDKVRLAFDSSSSIVVEKCQICESKKLEPVLFLGYLPPVNTMPLFGTFPQEQPSYPALLLYCPQCQLVQLGLIVDPKILFPPEYPYTSSTTKILRDNFAELYSECTSLFKFGADDLVVDIGSNDGNLLSNFKGKHKVLGVTPEEIGKIAIERGIPTIIKYFNKEVVNEIIPDYGQAKIITATNVFAHIENINEIAEDILLLLKDDGIFISESHYLVPLIESLQYDTIYHEHLRYYSLTSLKYLLEAHGLEIIHAKPIPTHGGSIRVYASRKGKYPVKESVAKLMEKEKISICKENLLKFKDRVIISKLELMSLLYTLKKEGKKIYGISAPSRASTLINYTAIDEGIVDYVLEVKGSHKIGKYVPGTLIPVVEESKLFNDQPDYALLFSWHIADELMPKLKQKGFKGDFIVPLPNPQIVKNSLIT